MAVSKSERIDMRCTAEQKLILSQAAERLDMTISDFILKFCMPVAAEIARGAPVPDVIDAAGGTVNFLAVRYATEPVQVQVGSYGKMDFEPITFRLKDEDES